MTGGIMTNRTLKAGVLVTVALGLCWGPQALAQDDPFAALRADMIETIAEHARSAASATGRAHLSPQIMETMHTVPRHAFLGRNTLSPRPLAQLAYADRPVPIGHGQTISQPFIVALMTDLLAPEPDHVVLEIGSGSGYQAAVLSGLVDKVCTIEIIPELGKTAAKAWSRQGYANIEARIGDGYYGWEACGPFDGIVVTAAAGHIPPPLVRQLKPGGRMVIPVGGAFVTQQLVLVEKDSAGQVTTRQLLPVAFVPLVRGAP